MWAAFTYDYGIDESIVAKRDARMSKTPQRTGASSHSSLASIVELDEDSDEATNLLPQLSNFSSDAAYGFWRVPSAARPRCRGALGSICRRTRAELDLEPAAPCERRRPGAARRRHAARCRAFR